jgi:dienelactone hydrolase
MQLRRQFSVLESAGPHNNHSLEGNTMNYRSIVRTSLSLLLLSGVAVAQPPGITMEMIMRQLPLEGAPLAVAGPYTTMSEAAFESPRHILFRPTDLAAFPAQDTLPVVVWGNGGCAIENREFDGFLGTVASHGFLVLTTVRMEGDAERQQQSAADLLAAVSWAEAENARAGSPLQGKIDNEHVFVMGNSCGGFLSVAAGADPRVDSVGLFNSGVSAPNPDAPPSGGPGFPTTDALADLHGPALFINGGEVDFMYATSRANFDLVNHVPAFYGARDNAGHTATLYHPGGGEFANVASNWVRYHFKGDAEAGKMFVGADCGLCVLPTWETAAKGL